LNAALAAAVRIIAAFIASAPAERGTTAMSARAPKINIVGFIASSHQMLTRYAQTC